MQIALHMPKTSVYHASHVTELGGRTVIFDLEIHMAEGVPMKSMSIEKLRTVLIIKNG